MPQRIGRSNSLCTRIANTHTDSIGFNAGISQLIWDFGKTLAKINMAKYDTQSAQYDYDYDILNITYNVKMNYYNVLRSLANLDIYEQNVNCCRDILPAGRGCCIIVYIF